MNKKISKVAVLGSGIMGSGIACHFANIGVEVLLLDMPPNELKDWEKNKDLHINDKIVKNRIVNDMFKKCIKTNFLILESPFIFRNVNKPLKDQLYMRVMWNNHLGEDYINKYSTGKVRGNFNHIEIKTNNKYTDKLFNIE